MWSTVTTQPGVPGGAGGGQPYSFTQDQIPHSRTIIDPPPPYTASGVPPPGAGPPPNFFSPPQASYPGLEPLESADRLFIRQEVTDIFFNSRNHFKVFSATGQPLYAIVEKTGALMRFLGGRNQSFSLILKDLSGRDLVFMEGSPGFMSGGAGVAVTYQGTRLGGVAQGAGDICNPQYNICDPTGNPVLVIRSQDNCCCMGAGGTAEFPLLTLQGEQIGRIGKEWGGFAREFFTSADTFGVNFPQDLHVAVKVVLLAAALMIDFQFFEGR